MRFQFRRAPSTAAYHYLYRGTTGVTYDGFNDVSAWADQSGNVNTLSAPVAPPEYNSSVFNSNPSISWADDGLSTNRVLQSAVFTQGAISTPYTLYSVHQFTADPSVWGESERTSLRLNNSDASIFIQISRMTTDFEGDGDRKIRLTSDVGGSGYQIIDSYTASAWQEPLRLICIIVNGANSEMYISNMSTAFWTGTLGGNGVDRVLIGASVDGDSPTSSDIWIGYTPQEICVPGAATSLQRSAMKTTLEALWGSL